jgi:hypothetical protein
VLALPQALVTMPSRDSLDSLEQYDARLARLDTPDGSYHDTDAALKALEALPEEA